VGRSGADIADELDACFLLKLDAPPGEKLRLKAFDLDASRDANELSIFSVGSLDIGALPQE